MSSTTTSTSFSMNKELVNKILASQNPSSYDAEYFLHVSFLLFDPVAKSKFPISSYAEKQVQNILPTRSADFEQAMTRELMLKMFLSVIQYLKRADADYDAGIVPSIKIIIKTARNLFNMEWLDFIFACYKPQTTAVLIFDIGGAVAAENIMTANETQRFVAKFKSFAEDYMRLVKSDSLPPEAIEYVIDDGMAHIDTKTNEQNRVMYSETLFKLFDFGRSEAVLDEIRQMANFLVTNRISNTHSAAFFQTMFHTLATVIADRELRENDRRLWETAHSDLCFLALSQIEISPAAEEVVMKYLHLRCTLLPVPSGIRPDPGMSAEELQVFNMFHAFEKRPCLARHPARDNRRGCYLLLKGANTQKQEEMTETLLTHLTNEDSYSQEAALYLLGACKKNQVIAQNSKQLLERILQIITEKEQVTFGTACKLAKQCSTHILRLGMLEPYFLALRFSALKTSTHEASYVMLCMKKLLELAIANEYPKTKLLEAQLLDFLTDFTKKELFYFVYTVPDICNTLRVFLSHTGFDVEQNLAALMQVIHIMRFSKSTENITPVLNLIKDIELSFNESLKSGFYSAVFTLWCKLTNWQNLQEDEILAMISVITTCLEGLGNSCLMFMNQEQFFELSDLARHSLPSVRQAALVALSYFAIYWNRTLSLQALVVDRLPVLLDSNDDLRSMIEQKNPNAWVILGNLGQHLEKSEAQKFITIPTLRVMISSFSQDMITPLCQMTYSVPKLIASLLPSFFFSFAKVATFTKRKSVERLSGFTKMVRLNQSSTGLFNATVSSYDKIAPLTVEQYRETIAENGDGDGEEPASKRQRTEPISPLSPLAGVFALQQNLYRLSCASKAIDLISTLSNFKVPTTLQYEVATVLQRFRRNMPLNHWRFHCSKSPLLDVFCSLLPVFDVIPVECTDISIHFQ